MLRRRRVRIDAFGRYKVASPRPLPDLRQASTIATGCLLEKIRAGSPRPQRPALPRFAAGAIRDNDAQGAKAIFVGGSHHVRDVKKWLREIEAEIRARQRRRSSATKWRGQRRHKTVNVHWERASSLLREVWRWSYPRKQFSYQPLEWDSRQTSTARTRRCRGSDSNQDCLSEKQWIIHPQSSGSKKARNLLWMTASAKKKRFYFLISFAVFPRLPLAAIHLIFSSQLSVLFTSKNGDFSM